MLFFMAPCQYTDVNYCLIIKRKKKAQTQESTHAITVKDYRTVLIQSRPRGLGPKISHQPWLLQELQLSPVLLKMNLGKHSWLERDSSVSLGLWEAALSVTSFPN